MVLPDLLSGLGRLLKLSGKTDIDSPICKLHHNFTTTILLCFCLLVTATNLIGDPIQCTFQEHTLMKDDFVNTYCWIHATYTLPGKNPTESYHGMGHAQRGDEIVFHNYYQWVPFVLFLQALLFFAPYWLWKTWEGGKMAAASEELTNPIMAKDDRKEKIQLLAEYLHASLHQHNLYAAKYLFCEILNFFITVVNIFLMNKFLGGKFVSYGTEVLSLPQMEVEHRTDPMIALFPRMTKCTFRPYGASGTIENLDALCLMPHNIVNEKVFLFLWVWFWMLLVTGALAVLWRCLVFFVPFIRIHLLTKYTRGLNKNEVKILSMNLGVGDYFVFYLLHKNVSEFSFADLMKELSRRIGGKASDNLEMGENVTTSNKGYYLGPYLS